MRIFGTDVSRGAGLEGADGPGIIGAMADRRRPWGRRWLAALAAVCAIEVAALVVMWQPEVVDELAALTDWLNGGHAVQQSSVVALAMLASLAFVAGKAFRRRRRYWTISLVVVFLVDAAALLAIRYAPRTEALGDWWESPQRAAHLQQTGVAITVVLAVAAFQLWKRSGTPPSTSAMETLREELRLLREDNANLRLEQQRALSVGRAGERIRGVVADTTVDREIEDGAWESLTEAMVMKTALVAVCRDLQTAAEHMGKRLTSIVPAAELDRRSRDPHTPEMMDPAPGAPSGVDASDSSHPEATSGEPGVAATADAHGSDSDEPTPKEAPASGAAADDTKTIDLRGEDTAASSHPYRTVTTVRR